MCASVFVKDMLVLCGSAAQTFQISADMIIHWNELPNILIFPQEDIYTVLSSNTAYIVILLKAFITENHWLNCSFFHHSWLLFYISHVCQILVYGIVKVIFFQSIHL